jgi:transposase-like protein
MEVHSMSVMSDLQRFEKNLVARIKELQAHVAELEELRAIAKRLGLNVNGATTSPRRARGTARTKPASTAKRPARRSTATAGARRSTATRSRSGGRRDQVLAVVQANPNIRVSDVAAKIGLKDPTSLYRVVRQLEKDGKVTKKGPLLSAK